MRIQELERKTGLERPSIRFYEKEGLLNPKRLENGYRDYSEEDAELLKKIKLLRRLGMSIDKIRALQQGSEDLSHAIAHLTGYHSSQIDDHKRCRAVCEAIHEDGAAFPTLNAEHYWQLLQEIRIDDRALGRSDFQENVPEEIHPWRRFFARTLDYGLWHAMVQFFIIVILRVRPIPDGFADVLITIGAAALFIPVEALMLHKFGTTPGKWALGIRIEYIQGGNLPYSAALRRCGIVYVMGMGCCIPYVEEIVNLVRYFQLTGRSLRRFSNQNGPIDMLWDEESELQYRDFDLKRGVAAAAILVLTVAVGFVTGHDAIKPKYRGDELTIAQFAQNYNATLYVIQDDVQSYEKLKEDGTKFPVPDNTVVVDLNGGGEKKQTEFLYELKDNDQIRSVAVRHTWDSPIFLNPLAGDPLNIASTLLLAQEDCGLAELEEFMELFEAHLDLKAATFVYKNLTVEWVITTELPMKNGLISQGEEEDSVELEFKVIVN